MTFLAPIILFVALGVALPILAHLLSRHKVQRTDWAAMQFLQRFVRVRSRQIRLRDILLLCLRCLAILLLVSALARPFLADAEGLPAGIGERRAGVLLALDASYSMAHSDGNSTRFEKAIARIRTIVSELLPGDPVSLVLLGAEHEVVARNMAYEPARFEALLQTLRVTPEGLDLDSVPRTLQALAESMDAHQKAIYIGSDLQARDWRDQPAWLRRAFEDLAAKVPTTVVAVHSGPDNLAITDLGLVSGVMRRDTIARYRATVRNYGAQPATEVQVKGLADGITVDTKTIPAIAPGASETVSLFVHFRNAGPVRIRAELAPDALPVDNTRRMVAVVREQVAVLSVTGSSPASAGRPAGFLAAALKARGSAASQKGITVRSVGWVDLPSLDLAAFDVVVLQDVPDITPELARILAAYVRAGHGLIWFAGDHVDADAWNKRGTLGRMPLLPAVIEQWVPTSDAVGVGRPLDPSLPDHAVCLPLRSLPEDLLSETRFRKVLKVRPTATSSVILAVAGSDEPLLLEHSLGRGQVFMFTTSADPAWSNMAVTPMFPMVLQQMVTYLTSRVFEAPRQVGDSLSLSYVDQPDASEAVFETPSGETIAVPVREHRARFVARLGHARQAGFYLARVRLQAPGVPIAVDVDTAESDVRCLTPAETTRCLDGTGIAVTRSDVELLAAVASARRGRSFSLFFLLAGLGLLVLEIVLAGSTRRTEAT